MSWGEDVGVDFFSELGGEAGEEEALRLGARGWPGYQGFVGWWLRAELVIRLRSEDPFLSLEALGVVEEHVRLAWAAAAGSFFQTLGVEMGWTR